MITDFISPEQKELLRPGLEKQAIEYADALSKAIMDRSCLMRMLSSSAAHGESKESK